MLDTTTGKLTVINDKNVYGGFSSETFSFAWSPDSKWIAYPRSMANHLHAIFLYSVDSGQSAQVTSVMGDSREPAFDREGKYLYFLTSTNEGATSDGLDMTSDLYQVTSNIYAVTLAVDTASPVAPEMEDEKTPAEEKADGKKGDDKKADDKKSDEKAATADEKAPAKPPVKPVKVDLDGIEKRIVAMPIPASVFTSVTAGLKGSLYFTEDRSVGQVQRPWCDAEPVDAGRAEDGEAGGTC